MKWTLVFLCAIAGSAQTPGQNAVPKLQPYQMKALENALRTPDAATTKGFSGPSSLASFSLIYAPLSKPVELAKTCVIPLLSVPVDPDVDRGIRQEALATDPMPVLKGLPNCANGNMPAR
jgi:hypothetical protein